MAAPALVPSLSDSGWISDNRDKVSALLSYFYASQYSQSQFFYGNVSSMSYLLYKYGTNPSDMAAEVESTLLAFLSRYLNNVIVEVTPNISDNLQASINIYLQFLDDNGNPVTFSNLLLIEGSKIVKIVNANNTGEVSNLPV